MEEWYLERLITSRCRFKSDPRNHVKNVESLRAHVPRGKPRESASHDKTTSLSGGFLLRESRAELHRNSFYATMCVVYYVYVLENDDDETWYIGYTEDIDRRIKEHNTSSGGRTTRIKDGDWEVIYYEAYPNKQDAIGREEFLKSGSGRRFLKKQLSNYLEE